MVLSSAEVNLARWSDSSQQERTFLVGGLKEVLEPPGGSEDTKEGLTYCFLLQWTSVLLPICNRNDAAYSVCIQHVISH